MFEVSVITTLYNYRQYIGDCIKSFLNQDFSNSEMIIVDDGSTDNPQQVIHPFLCERVKYIRLPENTNYSNAKNVGIYNSSSEVLVMLDADDMLTPGGMSCRFKKLQEGYDLVHGPVLRMQGGITKREGMWSNWLKTLEVSHIHAQSMMLRKDIHRKIGLYDTKLWASGDREMIFRIANFGLKIGTVDEDVAIYRVHPLQMHKSRKKMQARGSLKSLVKDLVGKRKKGDYSGLEFLE